MKNDATTPSDSDPTRERRIGLVLALLFGALLRGALLLETRVVERDGIEYLFLAKNVAQGSLREAVGHYYPPGYPVLLVPWAAFGEAGARLFSALLGLMTVALVHALVLRRGGRKAANLAACVAALHPGLARLETQVLSEPLLIVLLLASWVVFERAHTAASRCPAALAGFLSGLAYLVKPEGLGLSVLWVVFLAARRNFVGALLVAGGALLPVLPYMAAIRDEPIFTYEATKGDVKLTKKQDIPALLQDGDGETAAGRYVRNLAGGAVHLPAALQPAPLLLIGLGLLTLRRRNGDGDRSIGFLEWTALSGAAAYFLGYGLVREDLRHILVVVAFLVPLAGRGGAYLLARLERRHPAAAPVFLAILATSLVLPAAFSGRDRLALREAGSWVKDRGGAILATDVRVPYYATGLGGREHALARPIGLDSGEGVRRILDRMDATGARYLAILPHDRFESAGPPDLDAHGFRLVATFPDGNEAIQIWER